MASTFRRSLLLASMLFACANAHGSPFDVTTTRATAFPGDSFSASLRDQSTQGFEGLDVYLRFDAARLAFVDALPGDVVDGLLPFANVLSSGLVEITESLTTAAGPADGSAGSLVGVELRVIAGAPPGPASLQFGCAFPDPGLPDLCSTYAVDASPATLATVQVLQAPQGVPEPSSLLLAIAALLAGAVTGRSVRWTNGPQAMASRITFGHHLVVP